MEALRHWGPWAMLIVPAIGLMAGSVAGLLVQRVEPQASGSGIPHIKGVLLRLRSLRPFRILAVKFFGGVAGIGAGLSLGREGPTVQMGAAVAGKLGGWMGIRPRAMGPFIACGAGAGLAAAFNAPLAGFVFVLEELRREMSPLTYGGALVATVCADIVARWCIGQMPSFRITHAQTMPLTAMPAIILLGALGGVAGVVWNRLLLKSARWTRANWQRAAWIRPGIAAALMGLIAFWMPEVLGGGNAFAERVLSGSIQEIASAWMAAILLVKVLATVGCYASGAPGGIFAPMLLMGALLGTLTGRGFVNLAPGLGVSVTAMAVLGMAAWYVGSVRAPLTGIVLVLEMTGNYDQLFAIAVCCLVSYLAAEVLRDKPIYDALLEDDLTLPGKTAERAEPVHVVIGIHHDSTMDGLTLREVPWPPGSHVIGLERRGRELVPHGSTQILAGDHITVMVAGESPNSALKIVELATSKA